MKFANSTMLEMVIKQLRSEAENIREHNNATLQVIPDHDYVAENHGNIDTSVEVIERLAKVLEDIDKDEN